MMASGVAWAGGVIGWFVGFPTKSGKSAAAVTIERDGTGWSKPALMGAFTLGLAVWGAASYAVGAAIAAGGIAACGAVAGPTGTPPRTRCCAQSQLLPSVVRTQFQVTFSSSGLPAHPARPSRNQLHRSQPHRSSRRSPGGLNIVAAPPRRRPAAW